MKYLLIALFFAIPSFGSAQSKSVEIKPTIFYNNFSHKFMPITRVQQGDTIKSESVDAGGFDKLGKRVAKSGNPLTGPFFIEGALPGDILAITLTDVSLNRNYASTVEGFIQRSLPIKNIKEVSGRNAKRVTWKLDNEKGNASPESVYEYLHNFTIPLQPFLGCIGVAAPERSKEPLTYSADEYGGNMDFNRITKGATIYLPVFHQGALLYVGDGHAAQGDGELNGDALETSMNFAFVARVIKSESKIMFPRIEDSEYIISMAMGKTLEEALEKATLGLSEWLQQDYSLTFQEVTQVIGSSVEYRIPTLASPKFEIAAMIKKKCFEGIKK